MLNSLFLKISTTALYIDASIGALLLTLVPALILVLGVGAMIACAVMAKKRGENVALWVLVSVFIGWIAVIILYIIG